MLYYIKKKIKELKIIQNQKKQYDSWLSGGKTLPPPAEVKQKIIRELSKEKGYNCLVETGTYKGIMVYYQFPFFEKIFSIELSKELHDSNLEKFKDFPNISLFHGNSGEVLNEIVANLSMPSLFWLDAHYSEGKTAGNNMEVPIFKELETISKLSIDFSILIDDISSFDGTHGYPTFEELKKMSTKLFKNHDFSVNSNIFFITPKS